MNEMDVHRIDFYNMNPEFYQHTDQEIVEGQTYHKRDSRGFVGKAAYPWSAKLNTIQMGKVAFDVLEMKRFQRDYNREKFTKSLVIIDKEDDMPEVLFKLFEQMRLMNDDLLNHLTI